MNSRHLLCAMARLVLLAGLHAHAFAAGPVEYHCSGDGVSWTSSRPCAGSNRNEMRALGPGAQVPSSDTAGMPAVGKAPEHL